jgi:hypothetical protein
LDAGEQLECWIIKSEALIVGVRQMPGTDPPEFVDLTTDDRCAACADLDRCVRPYAVRRFSADYFIGHQAHDIHLSI